MRVVVPASLGLLLVTIAGLRLRLPDRPAFRWFARAVLPASGLIAIGLTSLPVLSSPYFSWNDPRLAISAAVLAGQDMYATIGHGAVLGHVYGPVSPIAFLPAVLMPTPGLAIAVGALLAFFMFALPAVLVLHREGASLQSLVWLACLTLWLAILTDDILLFTAFSVHADAPAIGFSVLACALVYRERDRGRLWLTVASAFTAVLSVGSKQVAVPLLVVLPLWIGLADGWAAMRRYIAVAIPVGLLTLLAVVSFIDFRTMTFNTFVVLGVKPFKPGGWLVLLERATRDLGPRIFPFLLVAALVALLDWKNPAGWRAQPREWLRNNPWTVFIVLALCSIPLAILGRSISGGSTNALAYPLFFALVGAVAGLLAAARRFERIQGVPAGRAVAWAMTMACAFLALTHVPMLLGVPEAVRAFKANPDDAAAAFWRQHPDEVYLPFNPLVGLMADGVAYHFSWALYDRELAGYRISHERFLAHVPKRLKYVAVYGPDIESDYSRPYLPEFTRPIQLDGLPGWSAVGRPNDQ